MAQIAMTRHGRQIPVRRRYTQVVTDEGKVIKGREVLDLDERRRVMEGVQLRFNAEIGDRYATLDGIFNAAELRAIADEIEEGEA